MTVHTPGTALGPTEHVLLLIARETIAGDDGISVDNLQHTFLEFDWREAVELLTREGALTVTVNNSDLVAHSDWRDSGAITRTLLTMPDAVVRIDKGIDDMNQGIA